MALPEQLLLSDLLRLRVRCDQGLDHGPGVYGWMHPPVHRLLGWASRPSAIRPQRQVWRLDQLRGISAAEAFVRGEAAEADPALLEQLPTLLQASLLGAGGRPLGRLADAAVELSSGRILHYLIARSDPRLPGSSRWRLLPERILDQRSGAVETALESLDDLPLARASVRQELLRRSRRWREQMGEETSRLRERLDLVGGRLEERMEGWLEEPPWEERRPRHPYPDRGVPSADPWVPQDSEPDPLEDWLEDPPADGPQADLPDAPAPRRRSAAASAPMAEPWEDPRQGPWTDPDPDADGADGDPAGHESAADAELRRPSPRPSPRPPARGPDRYRGRDRGDDPWV